MHLELVGHAGRRVQPHRLANLADAGRVAAPLDRFADHLEDSTLAQGQPRVILAGVGQRVVRGHGALQFIPRERSDVALSDPCARLILSVVDG